MQNWSHETTTSKKNDIFTFFVLWRLFAISEHFALYLSNTSCCHMSYVVQSNELKALTWELWCLPDTVTRMRISFEEARQEYPPSSPLAAHRKFSAFSLLPHQTDKLQDLTRIVAWTGTAQKHNTYNQLSCVTVVLIIFILFQQPLGVSLSPIVFIRLILRKRKKHTLA